MGSHVTFAVLLLAAGGYTPPSAPRLTADAGILVGSGLASREEYDRAVRSWRSVGAAQLYITLGWHVRFG